MHLWWISCTWQDQGGGTYSGSDVAKDDHSWLCYQDKGHLRLSSSKPGRGLAEPSIPLPFLARLRVLG